MPRPALFLLVCFVLPACGRAEAPLERDSEPAGAAAEALFAPAASGGTTHLVRLVARGDQYGFDPPELRVRPGDVVRFVHTGYQPESVAFDADAATPEAGEFLRRHALDAGPLLIQPGAVYDVSFRDAPPGVYPFYSVPHREFGMAGRVIVEP